jgi:O-antigen/teichoic acid export membrane protein
LSSYWSIGFGFIVTVVLTRILSAEAFGQFAYAMFFVQLLSLSPKLGLNYAFIQYKEATDEALGTYLVLEFLTVLGTFLLTLLLLPLLPASVVAICLVMAVTAFIGFGSIGGLLLDKELQLGRTSMVQSIAIPLSYVPAFLIAVNGGGVWSLIAQVVAQRLLTLVMYTWMIRSQLPRIWRSWRHFNLELARRFLGMGVTIGLSTFIGRLSVTLDNFFIGRFVGEVALGYYDRAFRTAQWPSTLLTNMVSRTSLFTYTKLQDDYERLYKAFTMVSWIVTALAIPFVLVIFVTASDIIKLLYGERWLPSVPFLSILVIISAFWPLFENLSTLFVAVGKPKVNLWSVAVQGTVLALVGLPLTITWGVLGTCIAVGTAAVARMGFMFWAVARQLSINVRAIIDMPVIAGLLAFLAYFLLGKILADIDSLPILLRVFVKSGFTILLYGCTLYLLQPTVLRQRVSYVWRLLSG